MILIWKKGNIYAKVYMLYTPLLMFLTIWNPIIGRIIAENITKVPSYWRVFWLIPAGPSIIYAIILLMEKAKKNSLRGIILVIGIALIIAPGQWMFSYNNGFVMAENAEKLPSEVIIFGNRILDENDNAILLGCDDFASTIRQKFTGIELIYSRYQYVLDLFQYRGEEEQASDRIQMMNFVNGNSEDYNIIEDLLEKYDVNYIVISTNLEGEKKYLLSLEKWKIKDVSEKYILLEKRRVINYER